MEETVMKSATIPWNIWKSYQAKYIECPAKKMERLFSVLPNKKNKKKHTGTEYKKKVLKED